MEMQFEMMRLSLVQRPQRDAFERSMPGGAPFTREDWLRDVFSREIDFQHQGKTFHYSPQSALVGAPAIVGRIGRQVAIPDNEGPDGHLAPKEHKTWRAAIVLIDPTHHDDGQKGAVEHLSVVGRPVPIFESLAARVSGADEPFVLEVNAIVPSESFWNFVKANEGQITWVQFEFVAPNMFGEADDYDSEMRDMQKQEGAQKAKLTLESKDGLNLNTRRVRQAADYTNKGAGSTAARTSKGKKYNSKEKAKRISIPNKDIDPSATEGLSDRIFRHIFRPS
jgi:hypothetical protein